ncbi:MAG: hypothetical protein ACREOJ_20980 [Gemmatimonadaceae bacterium]
MPSFAFYAAADDARAVLDHVFESTDCRVYEAYSEYDRPLREFASRSLIEQAWPLGDDPHATGAAVFLQLWSPQTVGAPRIERIRLQSGAVHGRTHRYVIGGWGLLQLQFGGVAGRTLTASRLALNSKSRAARWQDTYLDKLGPIDAWDWSRLARVARALQSHLRHHLSVERLGTRPVLRAAAQLREAGFVLREA